MTPFTIILVDENGKKVHGVFFAIKTETGIRHEFDKENTPSHVHDSAQWFIDKWNEMGKNASDYTEEMAIEELTMPVH